MTLLSPDEIHSIQKALQQAGELALAQPAGQAYQLKADRTPFTRVETTIEVELSAFLNNHFPGSQIISEESGITGGESPYKWLLDPIDGTKMYLIGGATWGISLGLFIREKPVLGFFYLPKSRDLYWGGDDYGAYLNDSPLDPGILPDPDDPLVFLGAPSSFHRRFQVRFPRIRILGSTALPLAFVASGFSIGALTRRVYLWDLAGMLPILEQTGVQLEFFSGRSFSPGDYLDCSRLPEELLAARPSQMGLVRSMINRVDR